MKTDTNKQNNTNDELLLANLLKGDPESLQLLYSKYFPGIYRTCYAFAGNRDDAFDLSQDILMKAFSRAASFRGRSRFSTWLYAIAHNHCISHARTKRVSFDDLRAVYGMMTDDITQEEFEFRSRKEEIESRMDHYLDRLGDEDKKMLKLRYQENYSVKELQDKFNLSASAVKMRLMRARKKLAAQI